MIWGYVPVRRHRLKQELDKEIIKGSKRKLFNKVFLKKTHFEMYIRLSWKMNQKARRALAHEFKAEASGSIIIGVCD